MSPTRPTIGSERPKPYSTDKKPTKCREEKCDQTSRPLANAWVNGLKIKGDIALFQSLFFILEKYSKKQDDAVIVHWNME